MIMRHIFSIPVLLAILLNSCSKEDNKLEQISDSLQGTYRCISMDWKGNPIDLDGDGNQNANFYEEFSSFANAVSAFASPVRIEPVSKYNQEYPIQLYIPMQFLKYNKVSKEYSLRYGLAGNTNYVFFSFTVEYDGSLTFSTRNDRIDNNMYRDGQWDTEGVDYPTTCAHHVLYFKEGTFAVRIIGTYYDFASQQLVTGPVDLTYERVSYSVN